MRKTTLGACMASMLWVLPAHAEAGAESAPASIRRPDAALRIARVVNVVTNGLQAGWFLGTKLQVSPVREDLDGSDWIRFQGSFNRSIGPLAPFIMATTAGANAAPLLFDHDFRKVSVWLNTAGLALNVAAIVTTLVGNVPVNDVTESASPASPPSNWQDLRSQWETFHTVRSVLSTTAFVLNTTALVIDF